MDLEGDRYRAGCGGHARVYQCYEGECAPEGFLAGKAKARAEREFACQSVDVRWVNDETYHVEGCKRAANYDCDSDGCVVEGAGHDASPLIVVVP
jgi:hypothetical protein